MLHLDFLSCVDEVIAADTQPLGSNSMITRFYKENNRAIVLITIDLQSVSIALTLESCSCMRMTFSTPFTTK